MSDEKRGRKQRSDKGLVMATLRDRECIGWISEMYAARADQVRALLSRYPDEQRPFKSDLIAETTLKDQLSRWRRGGWVEYRRVLADQPGWVFPTKKGLALVDLDEIYAARQPAATRLNHLYAVNQIRLWMDEDYKNEAAWKSERRFRSEQIKLLKKGDELGAIPDGVLVMDDGDVMAIEAEISTKKSAEVFEKLSRLVHHHTSTREKFGYTFDGIWFYVPNERIKKLIETGIASLQPNQQERVSVLVEEDLLAVKR